MKPAEAMRRCHMTVFRPGRRRMFTMRWIDPATGARRERSTGNKVKTQAYQIAGELAMKVAAGVTTDDVHWDDFTAMYEAAIEADRIGRAKEPWLACKRKIAKVMHPMLLDEITATWIVTWQQKLKAGGASVNTMGSHSARLRRALHWAEDQGLIDRVPKIKVKIEEAPRSRAITGEEFDRMLLVVSKVRPADHCRWERFLRGLWSSGFRISELLALSWDEGSPVHLDASGRFPLVYLAPDSNKSRKMKIRPVTPEFWALAASTPPEDRHGPVFPVPGKHGQISAKRAVRIIAKFGAAAGIITNLETKKLATSHDLRRAFTTRLDGRLTLPEIQKWGGWRDMRTVMTYYHSKDAETLAAKLWAEPASGAANGAPSGDSDSAASGAASGTPTSQQPPAEAGNPRADGA